MRFLFVVQGEGRGHMTQAIAMSSILREAGHEISHVVVGRSEQRLIPSFFKEHIGSEIIELESPNFVTGKDDKSVLLFRSILFAISRISTYLKSIRSFRRIVREDKPDVIINFYDFIAGLAFMFKRPKAKCFCIAHQYLADHSSFEYANGTWVDRKAFSLGNWITSLGSDVNLALSFRELPDEPGIDVVPPLLRKEVRDLEVSDEGHILVYMLNPGYADDVHDFHEDNADWQLHCFWDKRDAEETERIDDSLTFHRLNGKLFLDYMSSCKGFITTAGFESVCEAMYLGKPVMMVPVNGHYEQACNALDATKSGAGIASQNFDLMKLIDYIPMHVTDPDIFRRWADRSSAIFIDKLTKHDN